MGATFRPAKQEQNKSTAGYPRVDVRHLGKHVVVFPPSMRQYTVPDPPGLFDGHVWPMYIKHRREMEESQLSIGEPS